MTTQESRLKEWDLATQEETVAMSKKRKRENRSRPKLNRSAYRDRLIDEAVKGIHERDLWLREETGYIEAEDDEETFKIRQDEIAKNVPIGGSQKAFELHLPELGPYCIDYSPNGRYLLIGGRKGHLAQFDWQTGKLSTEIQVYETVRDVKFLHNHLYWAAAQKKYVYIYDQNGIELHRLKSLHEPHCLEFLPHHFLLCSTGNVGFLAWQDTTCGKLVASFPTKKGCCRVMKQNPWNAVLCLGHSFGCVTMWTPNTNVPVAQIKCHKTPISALAVDLTGRYLVTCGMERMVKVWDIRKFDELHCYFTSRIPDSVSIGQTGLLGIAYGSRAEVWKDALATKQQKPYLVHRCTGHRIHDLSFCPYEDVLGVGHAAGLCHMLVPGAGEANYDTFVADPFQTKKGRRESEVSHMLDKLPPELIVLDPSDIQNVRRKAIDETLSADDDDSEKEEPVPVAKEKAKAKEKKRREAPENVPFSLRRFYA